MYICHRHKNGFGKETMRFGISVMFGIFGVDAGRCANEAMAVLLHICCGFPAKIMEQMIVTSLYDVMRFSCAKREGNMKGECNQALGVRLLLLLSCGCFDTSVWVFTKPRTLNFGCLGAPRVGSISWMDSVVCFSH